jgi:predicted AlkP superfamily phosphohydrolase/phosphomutase
VVLGFDGLEPKLVERLLERGELPSFGRLTGGTAPATIATTYPAQTPVAWSTFATGVNPGGHGIFDFIRRDPATYLPQPGLTGYEQRNSFVPPQAVNLRQGQTVWEHLSSFGIPSIVIRCPCTYPPAEHLGRTLSGMGVPDLRGSLGMPTFFTSSGSVTTGESECVVRVAAGGSQRFKTELPGLPRGKGSLQGGVPLEIELDPQAAQIVIRSSGEPAELTVREGHWSGWLRLNFRPGLLQSVRGMVRFYLVRQQPLFELYASPINFDTDQPPFPISWPLDYAAQLARELGPYHTLGMAEDHTGLTNGRLDEEAFLAQCRDVYREREAMLFRELERFDEGLLFCLFDTPDRVQHMFWRWKDADHPARRCRTPADGTTGGFELQDVRRIPDGACVIDEQYKACDATLGRVLQAVDDNTLVIALSDHGFGTFRRQVHINRWLHAAGLLVLGENARPGNEAGDMLRAVDWSRTRAYALGLGGIYLNLKGREAEGIVTADDAGDVARAITQGLQSLQDTEHNARPVRSVSLRQEIYRGPCAKEAPDLVVNFAAGYRTSWSTAMGGVAEQVFEDNVRPWSGDHIIDPDLVPGMLIMNRPFRAAAASMLDMAPTIVDALGVPRAEQMEGESLLS